MDIMKKTATAKSRETYFYINAASSKAPTFLKGLIEGVACDQVLHDLERAKINECMRINEPLRANVSMRSVLIR